MHEKIFNVKYVWFSSHIVMLIISNETLSWFYWLDYWLSLWLICSISMGSNDDYISRQSRFLNPLYFLFNYHLLRKWPSSILNLKPLLASQNWNRRGKNRVWVSASTSQPRFLVNHIQDSEGACLVTEVKVWCPGVLPSWVSPPDLPDHKTSPDLGEPQR